MFLCAMFQSPQMNVVPLAALQPREIRRERLEKAELRRLALGPGGAGRQVERDDRQISVLRLDVATFLIELLERRSP